MSIIGCSRQGVGSTEGLEKKQSACEHRGSDHGTLRLRESVKHAHVERTPVSAKLGTIDQPRIDILPSAEQYLANPRCNGYAHGSTLWNDTPDAIRYWPRWPCLGPGKLWGSLVPGIGGCSSSTARRFAAVRRLKRRPPASSRGGLRQTAPACRLTSVGS